MHALLPAAILLVFALPAPAAAQGVKRCTDARGNSVFTDRSCASLGAVAKGVPALASGATYARGFAPRGCARTADDLAMGVRTALEARDVNRLASYYHWPGSGNARRVMDALEAIALRPLVAVELAYPARPAPFDPLQEFGPNAAPEQDPALAADPGRSVGPTFPPDAGQTVDPMFAADPATASGFEPDPAYAGPALAVDPAQTFAPAARPPSAPRPIGLDVQQMAGDTNAGSRNTRFSLHRNVGCWWLSL